MANILIVDDDRDIRHSLMEVLRASGHQLQEAADGCEALDAVRQQAPDVVITDLVMPEIEGLELIRSLAAEFPSLKIIAISGGCYGRFDYLKAASAFGADRVLAKPFRSKQLCSAIDDLIDERTRDLPSAKNFAASDC